MLEYVYDLFWILHICLTFFLFFAYPNSGYNLPLDSITRISSHNYPDYYPPKAYILWTFHYDSGSSNNSDIGYYIRFGIVYLGSGDYLRVGYGWDPNDYSEEIASYGNYSEATVYPDSLVVEAEDVYIEFEADSYGELLGFELEIKVLNASCIMCKLVCAIPFHLP